MIEHFKFLKAHTKATPKMTIPSPSAVHFRDGRDAVPVSIYPDMEDFYRDLGQTYRKVVRAFADAGCRYLQLDEVNLTYLCDPKADPAGPRPRREPGRAAGGLCADDQRGDIGYPADMAITMHLCRGNFRSTFIASGGYEPVAETLFNTINVHGYFMEYDSERAGGFEPLRFVPKGKQVVLGLVTSKTGTLESKDEIKRRIDERRSSCRSTSSVSRRNAASPRARRATCSPRRAMGEAPYDRRDRERGVGMKRVKPPFRADHVGSLLRPR
jgi:5-methyltetrahydropteroyltriglutamate--homocysteine methyltransferase